MRTARTAEEFYAAISEYVSTLKGKNGNKATKGTQDKRSAILKRIIPVLIAHGHNEPDEGDYAEYCASQNVSPETAKEYTKKIQAFFEWYKEQGTTTSTADETGAVEPELLQPDDDVASAEPTAPNEPLPFSETVKTVKNKGGRKRYDTKNGEKRSVKFMVYFTPSVMAEFKDLCSLKHTTCANFLFKLACREIENNEEALTLFREGANKLR